MFVCGLKLISKFDDEKRWKKLFEILNDENSAFRFHCVYSNDNPSAFNGVFGHLLIETFIHLLKRELYIHKDGDSERALFVKKVCLNHFGGSMIILFCCLVTCYVLLTLNMTPWD